ncbi:VOC family protein [bacterium]|nr:VOC family protein [bacterium]
MSMHYLHTKLRVRDLDSALRFYESSFGYQLRSRRPGPEGSEIAFISLPGEAAELQLCQYPGDEAFAVPARMMHLAFKVEDIEAAVQALQAAGASLQSGPYAIPSGSRVAFLRDLDGYDLELVQKSK